MKVIAVLLAACASAASPDFEAYKTKFGKTYPSPDDEAKAKACWEDNIKVLAMQENAHPGLRFEENEFSDQCWNDFVAERAPLDKIDGTCVKSPVPSYSKKADETKILDWRDHGYVNEVKNQKSCGSCWAFSAVGCMEGAAFKAGGKLPSLSEQELISCDKTNNGCGGGMPGEAFAWAVQNGMTTEAEYPYEATTSSCKHSGGSVRFSSWQYINSNKPGSFFGGGGEPVLLAAVQNEGPISITLNANQVWHQYSSGIVDTDSCPNTGGINHAVLAVGYGKDGSKAYWIVRNSWGSTWGEKGYIRLAYNKNVCSLQSCFSAMIVGTSTTDATVV